nr:histidine kinase [uncultured Dyadobacter sp.]
MKKLILLFGLILPIAAYAQYGSGYNMLVMKQIRNGIVCDSCLITHAGSIGTHNGQVSFLTPNAENQFLYTDSALTTNIPNQLDAKFYVAMGRFSLDFYPYSQLDMVRKGKKVLPLDFKEVQFKTFLNGTAQRDWTDIITLQPDPDYYFGHTDLDSLANASGNIETIPAVHYHAGKIDLKLNDSLLVLFRNKHSMAATYRFTIRRVRSVPDYFEFVQFPSTKSFEEILNNEVNKRRTGQDPPSNYIEMEAGYSAFLRFANNDQYYFFGRTPRNGGVEYAIDQPDHWKALGSGGEVKFTNGFTYIYLNNPASGKTIKVFLRYKHQPESIHEVTIRVKTVPGTATWVIVVFLLSIAVVVFLMVFFIQKKRYKMRLRKLDRHKNEIENQLQLLSGQLNPHFLFNSLNAVQALIRQDDKEAANQYITEVATFMRTIMDSGRKELVSLAEEIQIEAGYIALEQKRRPFSYTLDNQCGHDLAAIDFPPLLLQPVIENSIRHGFTENISDPALTITIQCDARDLTVIVADNGAGFDQVVNPVGHGLSLSNKRIALINEKLAPMQITISTKSAKGKGCATEIRFIRWLS